MEETYPVNRVFVVGRAAEVRAATDQPPWMPDPKLTPGQAACEDANVVMQKGYAWARREVHQWMRVVVFRRHGLDWAERRQAPAQPALDLFSEPRFRGRKRECSTRSRFIFRRLSSPDFRPPRSAQAVR